MTAHHIEKSKARREGFWWSEIEPFLEMPKASTEDWKGRTRFLKKLKDLQAGLDPMHYKGWSNCRCCDKSNGSREYSHKGWIWPEGFAHYIEDHNIRPSLAFMEMVMGPLPRGRDLMDYAEAKAVREILKSEDADWMNTAFDLGDDNVKR